MDIRFVWDSDKDEINQVKHGISFVAATVAFDGRPLVTTESAYADEVRNLTTVRIDGRFWTIVWTPRSGDVRIISVRRSRKNEVEEFKRYYPDRG